MLLDKYNLILIKNKQTSWHQTELSIRSSLILTSGTKKTKTEEKSKYLHVCWLGRDSNEKSSE